MLDASEMVPFSAVYSVPAFFALFGAPLVAIGVRAQRVNAAVSNWPQVIGTIVTSRVNARTGERLDTFDKDRSPGMPDNQGTVRKETVYERVATYTFQFDGQTREGTKVTREGIMDGNQAKAQAWLAAHPPGTEVTVSVDPKDPAIAYIELAPRSLGGMILLIWGGVMMFIGAVIFVIFMLN